MRPIEPPRASRPRRRRGAVAALIVIVAGVVALLWFVGSAKGPGSGVESTTTEVAAAGATVPPDPSPTTISSTTASAVSTSSSSTTLAVLEPTLADLLPDAQGVLVAAITSQGGVDLVRWSAATPARALESPMLTGPFLEFDVSGQHMAFLGRSATAALPALYLGRPEVWDPALVGVSSFRWHASVPGQIAWMRDGFPRIVCWAEATWVEGLGAEQCVSVEGDKLAGFDSSGFLVVDHVQRTVDRFDVAGRHVATLPGTDALIGPDGWVLVVDQAPQGIPVSFSIAESDLSNAVELDWAPRTASGVYGFVAWSPINPPRLAFLVFNEGEGYELQLWEVDGELQGAVNLSGRVWKVAWDSTGRYLLVPGVLAEHDSVLQVYDTFSQEVVSLHFDNSIQDAHLVTPAVCENAAHVAAAFADRLPTDVSLGTARMVLSRDATLDSWYFMSARVVGGPFDGQLASWAHPGFHGSVDTTNTPNLAVPINESASYLGFGMTSLDPANYGVDDWLQLDGALASQRCVQMEDPQ